MNPLSKQELHQQCLAKVMQKITAAQEEISHLQSSMNEETKSSAGDKYETGREMIQQEMGKMERQLSEALMLKQTLEKISIVSGEVVQQGSLVISDQGIFYLTVSLGEIVMNDKKVFVISPAAPMGKILSGKKKGDTVSLNGRNYTVQEIL